MQKVPEKGSAAGEEGEGSGGELSDDVSLRSSFLGHSSSDDSSDSSESEAQAPTTKAEAKPVAAEEGKSEKGDGKVVPGSASKKPTRRSKDTFPFIAPGEYAPNHRGVHGYRDELGHCCSGTRNTSGRRRHLTTGAEDP